MAARMLSVSRLLSNLTTRMSSPLWINHPTIAATTAPIATYSHRLRRVFFGRGLPPTAPSPAGRGSSRTPAVLPGFRSWNRLPLRRPSSLIPGTWDATWCLYDHSKFSDIPAWSRPQPFASPPYDVLSTMTLPRGVCTNPHDSTLRPDKSHPPSSNITPGAYRTFPRQLSDQEPTGLSPTSKDYRAINPGKRTRQHAKPEHGECSGRDSALSAKPSLSNLITSCNPSQLGPYPTINNPSSTFYIKKY